MKPQRAAQSTAPTKRMEGPSVYAVAVIEDRGQYTILNQTLTRAEWEELLASPETDRAERVEALQGWAPFSAAYRVLDIEDTEFDEPGDEPSAHGSWYFVKE